VSATPAIEFSALTALKYDEIASARATADDGANVDRRETGRALIGGIGRDDGSAGAAGDDK